MSIIQINRNPDGRTLKLFGAAWMLFMTLVGAGCWFQWQHETSAFVVWTLALIVPVIGWAAPTFMRLVYLGMSYAAWPIGFVVSHVILAMVYYVVLTPIGLAMRLAGRDPMNRRLDREATSYWIERPSGPVDAERYFRQF